MDLENLTKFLSLNRGYTVQRWLGLWVNNAAQNMERLDSDFFLEDLTDIVPPDTHLIGVGPGPSLDQALPLLKANPKPVISVNSALKALMSGGVAPYIVVVAHGEEIVGKQIKAVAKGMPAESILVCPITIHPMVPENWPGKVVWFTEHDPSPEYAAVKTLIHIVAKGRDLSKIGFITAGGCVLNCLLELSFIIGCRHLDLVGFELGGGPFENYYSNQHTKCKDANVPLHRSNNWASFKQMTGYRLSAEQRNRYFKGRDSSYTLRNLSPYSFLQIPAADMNEVLGGRNGN